MLKDKQKIISNRVNKKVLVFGKFDILHPGHMHILSIAKKFGDVTVVMESDQAIQALRDYKPYNNQDTRAKGLKKFGVDVFVRSIEHDAQYLINHLKPDVLCIGEDQKYLQDTFSVFDDINLEIIKFVKSNIYKSSRLKAILEDETAGIYLIDKAKGINSFRTVATIRKVLNIRQVGFSGTLDPLASGLMILASGKATRLLDWFHGLKKVYQADIIFGQTSNTYDMEGEIVINDRAKAFDKQKLEKQLESFIGQQSQIAPIFSAKKVAGQKLYKLARAGKAVKAPSKEIEIYSLKIKKFKYPQLTLELTVSAGTYIRSLAHDLGEAMGTGAMLEDLRRLAIGNFNIKKSLPLQKVDKDSLNKYRLEPQDIIKNLNEHLDQ